MGSSLIIYDGDCGFCDRSLRYARRRLRAGAAVGFTPWQSADLGRHGLSAELANRSIWLVRPGKPPLEGAQVFGYLARQGVAAWPALGRVMDLFPINLVAAGLYRLVAANRHRLAGGSACRLPTPRGKT